MVLVKIKSKEFYIDGNLQTRLDNVKHIVNKKNFDMVFIIDGDERVGKSTLAMMCGYYLSEGKFSINNVAFDSDDALKKIEQLPDKSVLVIDEGSLVFNSKDAMNKEQRKLIKIMNVVGAKNMVFIIVLPSFFDLNKQIAVRRSKFLIHCYTDNKYQRGRFVYYTERNKKLLYLIGKKNMDSYAKPKPPINHRGKYTSFNPLGNEYLELKKKSLYSALHEDTDRNDKQSINRHSTINYLLIPPF